MKSRVSLVAGALAGGAIIAWERHSKQGLERFAAASLETLLNAIEANDAQTGMHVRRVAACALVIADAAGLDESEQRAIERVALFHDIGKIHEALFDIVHDDTKLSASERREVRTHPMRGAQVLAPLGAFYPELPNGVLSHHERWDGRGYPRGLRGARIPLEARIVTIADTFDAVANTRRYRRGRGVGAAIDVIAAGRGTQFDPTFVDVTLLPPVIDQLARVESSFKERGSRADRMHDFGRRIPRTGRREHIPDITFRWRSESLRADGVHAPHRVD